MKPYQELSRSISGRTAIITGAASGMGRATAHLFAREGANVAVTDLDQDKVDTVVAEINDAGYTQAKGWALDVSDQARIKEVVAEVAAQWGGVDIIVNNAGFARFMSVDAEDYDAYWTQAIAVMLSSHQWMVRAALEHLKASDCARIVNIASTEGWGATPDNSPYVAAKHGVTGLTKAMAVDFGRFGITANCICPGPIHTGITEVFLDEHKEIYAKRRVPLRRYGIPEEVAHMTLSCCLPAASFMTGAVIPVDGGLLVKNA